MKSSVFSRDLKDAREMLGYFSSGARSSKILVRRQRKYEDPFAPFVSREQSNHHEQQIAGDNCMDRHRPVQAYRTDTMKPDHANTCRPVFRACTGFSDEWEASVNVRDAKTSPISLGLITILIAFLEGKNSRWVCLGPLKRWRLSEWVILWNTLHYWMQPDLRSGT